MISKKSDFPRQKPRSLRPYLLDSIYLGGLLVSVPYLFLTGRGSLVIDHFRRRWRPIPSRASHRPCVWVHGVSVGELLSVRRFLTRFCEEFDGWDVVLSTTTRAGDETGRLHYPDFPIITYPFDFSRSVRRAYDCVKPDLVVIVEHELWPNFLGEAQTRGVPVAIVNGRLSPRSLRGYRALSRVISWPPPAVVSLCVEDESSARGFRDLGVSPHRIHVTGNLKFDRRIPVHGGVRQDLGFAEDHWVFVASSTHPGEEDTLARVFRALHATDDRARFLLAPRRVDRAEEVARIVRGRGLRVDMWSRRSNRDSDSEPDSEVVIVDRVGELADLLAAGDAVFVGGSLVPFGGHNVIEPAIVGRPVLTGPHHGSFRSVVRAFRDRDALIVCRDGDELLANLVRLREDRELARGMAARALETVRSHAGASDRTLEALRPIVESIMAARAGASASSPLARFSSR